MFMTTTNSKLLTVAQLTAKIARGGAARTARAEARARIATELGLPIAHREVIREANAQLRNAGRP